MSAARSLIRGTTLAAISVMAAAAPSSSREAPVGSVGITPAPAIAPKQMRLVCRLYFGCVPISPHASHLEKENQ